MTIVPLALPTRSNKSRFGFEGAARIVNGYAEGTGEDAKNQFAIYGAEGLDTYVTPANGKTWALLPTETLLYGVTGVQVWAVDASDAVTLIGTLGLEGPVTMARNRRSPDVQVGLVSADNKYYVIEGTTMTLNTDTDLLGPPGSIDVRDGYFVISTNLNRYFITGEDDAENIGPTDFGKAQRSPDEIRRVIATENEICLMGSQSIEWHQNSPTTTASFPFVPVANIEIGLLSAQAVAKLNRTIAWLASDGTVRVMEGYGGRVISTPAVERAIGEVTDPSTISMFAWDSRKIGHSFIALKSHSWTWVYDVKEGSWLEKQSYRDDKWRVSAVCEWKNRLIAGDDTTGELYFMGPEYLNEAGSPLILDVQTAPVDSFPRGAIINRLVIDVIPGVGRPAVVGSENPRLLMSYSDDGGRTWSAERAGEIGRGGETNARVEFRRLGMVRRNGRTFRFRIPADVAKGLQSAFLDVEALA